MFLAVFCGGPPGLANGRPTASSFYYNSAAAYQCIDDYNLIGKDTVRCDENGTWSGEEPTCECKLDKPPDYLSCKTSNVLREHRPPTNSLAYFYHYYSLILIKVSRIIEEYQDPGKLFYRHYCGGILHIVARKCDE